MKRLTTDSFLSSPHAIVILLVMANAIAFLLCVRASGNLSIPNNVLIARGALIPGALEPAEFWRLIGTGFLHANPGHLLSNLVSLAVCGPFLEKRLGATAFTLVYFASLVGAGVASTILHTTPFVGVGASGAIFGILGALFALWILGADELSPAFFLVNFTLNFTFAARDSHVDWAAHIGGFVVGLASVALLDLLARTNCYWLRCKFPEFVKMNTMLLIGVAGAYVLLYPPRLSPSLDPSWTAAALWVLGVFAAVKSLDYLLAVRRGLAGVVVTLAVGNGMSAYVACSLVQPWLEINCRYASDFGRLRSAIVEPLCQNVAVLSSAVGVCALLLTLLAYLSHLRRGLRDVGFVGATFAGERQRERGLVRPTKHTRV